MLLPLLNKLHQFHHILAECETASVAQCMLVMQITICVVLRMAGGEDVERNWFLDPISLIKSSNPFLLCHSAGIASRTRVLFVDCSTFMSPPTAHTHPWRSRTSCYIWQSGIQGHMCNKIALIGNVNGQGDP